MSVPDRASSTCTWTHPPPGPTWARPRYHGDPSPDPSGPGPAALGQLRLSQPLGDPGLERTSGRRTRPPSRAQPTGNCSLKNVFGQAGCKPGKRAGPASQHAARLSFFPPHGTDPEGMPGVAGECLFRGLQFTTCVTASDGELHSWKCSSGSPESTPSSQGGKAMLEIVVLSKKLGCGSSKCNSALT